MANATIYGSTSDGALRKEGASWAACQAATPSVNTGGTAAYVLRMLNTGTYSLQRLAFAFDVSPYAGDTITAATLQLYLDDATDAIQADLYYYDWGTSLEAGDWVSVGSMVLAATSTPSGLGYQTWTLDSLSNILSKNGRFILVLHDESTEPTSQNYLHYIMADNGSNKPKLDITYTTGGGAAHLWIPSHHDGGLYERMAGGL